MLLSAIFAAHIATGIVKAFETTKGIDKIFCESLVKYAKVSDDPENKASIMLVNMRKEYPEMLLWSENKCRNGVFSSIYIVMGVKGFFTLFKPTKRIEGLTGKAFIDYIRKQHPKVIQGLVQ